MNEQIYLDNNSTTPIDPRVADAIHQCHLAAYANPASQHRTGRRTRRIIEQARESIAVTVGANVAGVHANRVILTSGGTESNNLALLGIAGSPPGRVIVSTIEHPSVLGPAEHLASAGFDVQYLRVNRHGVVDLNHLRELVDGDTRLVSIMAANNETGVIQPIQQAVQICDSFGVPLHTDAVQIVGKAPVNFRELGVAALSLAAHKFHGPRGVGALIVRHDITLQPILFGGFQQQSLRPGTESAAMTIGLQTALQLWKEEAAERAQHYQRLRDRLERSLLTQLPNTVINGGSAERLPHTSNLCFPGVDRQALVMALDVADVACSTGSACASGSSEPSPVLLAMGLSSAVIDASIRISLGNSNNESEIDQAIGHISRIVKDLRRQKSARN